MPVPPLPPPHLQQKSSRNTLRGTTAYERENRYNVQYGGDEAVAGPSSRRGKTEFDILKENHRFIRNDEGPNDVSWEERIARAYESKLFKEFALVDLKHYKSSRFALRWRTAEEVVHGVGETTCSSLRCAYHQPLTEYDLLDGVQPPGLKAFELPFAYVEAGEGKSALVKVRLCKRCERKLMWRSREKEGGLEDEEEVREGVEPDPSRAVRCDEMSRHKSLTERPPGSEQKVLEMSKRGFDRRRTRSRSPGKHRNATER